MPLTSYEKTALLALLLLSAPYSEAREDDHWKDVAPKKFESKGFYNDVTNKDNWSVTLGAGAGFGPKYEGSDKTEFSPLPLIDMKYKDGLFFAGTQGIGTTIINNDDANLSIAIGYDGGRDEKDDRKNLRGLGDIDASAIGIISGEYEIGPVTFGSSVQTGLGGDYGITADFSIGSGYPLTEKLMISIDINTTWASDEHMKSYFGVSQTQSTASGKNRFDAGSGFKSYGISFGAHYQISESWSVFADVRVDQLIGDASDSPVSVEDRQIGGFVAIGYSF